MVFISASSHVQALGATRQLEYRALEPGTLLRLRAHTRAPGGAWLEMRVTPAAGSGSRYDQRAIFFPRGLVGWLYWYALLPAHTLALRRMMNDVVSQLG